MSRRAPGEGSIVQRGDGRWQGSLQVGGRRRTVYGKSQRDVKHKLDELKRQSAALGALPDPGKRTVNDLLDHWLETVAPALKPRTQHDYRAVCEAHIRPALGGLSLGKVTPAHVQDLYNRLAAHPRTALKVHRALDQAFALAVRWGWLAQNPCERTVKPRYSPERREMWTPDELRTFIAQAHEHRLYALWVMALATGCRLGELLALCWGDVSLDAGTLTISKAGQHIGAAWVVTTPKTRAGERTIALPREAVMVLQAHRAQQAERRLRLGPRWRDGADLVFAGVRGQPLDGGNVTHALRAACDRLGLRSLSFHALRHMHASLLLAEGIPVVQVSARLGHATPAITWRVYAHALGNQDHEAAQAIGRALAGEDVERAHAAHSPVDRLLKG